LKNDIDAKVFAYIASLEKSNDELVKTLQHCIILLTEFKSLVPDPKSWQQMLDQFQKVLTFSAKITTKQIH
jgi:hypothetical protein